MRTLLLGLAACAAFSGLAKGDVVIENKAAQASVSTASFAISFTANANTNLTTFKFFGTDTGSKNMGFTLDNGVGSATITGTFNGGGLVFNLATATWTGGTGNSITNLASGNYSLSITNIDNFSYDTSTTNGITTYSGLGFSNGAFAGVSGNNYAIFELSTAVPEPGTLILGTLAACSGGAGVWWKRRRRQPVPAETADQPATV